MPVVRKSYHLKIVCKETARRTATRTAWYVDAMGPRHTARQLWKRGPNSDCCGLSDHLLSLLSSMFRNHGVVQRIGVVQRHPQRVLLSSSSSQLLLDSMCCGPVPFLVGLVVATKTNAPHSTLGPTPNRQARHTTLHLTRTKHTPDPEPKHPRTRPPSPTRQPTNQKPETNNFQRKTGN